MNADEKWRVAESLWLGFALAGLFFYPLTSALEGDPYYLQWQPRHSLEAAAAVAMLSVAAATLLHPLLGRSSRGATAAFGLVVLVPLLSLGAGVSRQVPFAATLRSAWEHPGWRYGAAAVVAAGVFAAFVFLPALMHLVLERSMLVLSPIAIVVVAGIARAALRPAPATAVERAPEHRADAGCSPVLALLFDEFSFAYLYKDGAIRTEFPNIGEFATHATSYLDVRSPGGETLVSVPGYLAGSTFDHVWPSGGGLAYQRGEERGAVSIDGPGSLFEAVHSAGLSSEVVGYYFTYCELLVEVADVCRSFSFYNAAATSSTFSAVDPIMTTLILWPRQFPLGLLKSPAFARHQRAIVEETARAAMRPLDATRPAFRLVHFSVPHLPFAFDEKGFHPRIDSLRQRPDDAYVDQLHFVDRLFGEIVGRFRRDGSFDQMTVVVFSDHGFRGGGRETDPRHVPFLVKRAGQTTHADVVSPHAGERLLRNVVTASCVVRAGS